MMENESNTKSDIEKPKIAKNVAEAYKDLHKIIDQMDRKVQLVIKKHESQFLYAYRSHIKKIKKQLYEIKTKAEEQEKMFSANDRIRYLQKQNAVFRQESIRLYQKLKQKNSQIEVLKSKLVDADKVANKYEKQAKQVIKENMNLQANALQFQQTIYELEKRIQEKQAQLQKLQSKHRKQYVESLEKISLINSRKKSPKKFKLTPFTQNKANDYQLKEWFIECIRHVKKEIGQRKNSYSEMDIYKIGSIQEFRLVDKLRLFELFLQNEKMLTWMYQKIFPDRLTQINEYLTTTNTPRKLLNLDQSSEKDDEEMQEKNRQQQETTKEQKSNRYSEQFSLPKLHTMKRLIRNQITLKNGKLNISLS